jgi:hypothetical protein
MGRLPPALVALAFFAAAAPIQANPPLAKDETSFQAALKVQRAMEQARYFLFQEANSQKAVDILEEHLSSIQGHAGYLRLLRDAYRIHIRGLRVAGKNDEAARYLERLAILDREALNDAVLNPKAKVPSVPAQPKALSKESKPASTAEDYYPRKQPPTTVRAKASDDDPFDRANERVPGGTAERRRSALQILARAEGEFAKRHYSQAKALYDQAHATDDSVTEKCKARWAYCKLAYVDELLKGPLPGPQSADSLRRELRQAMEMAPNLAKSAQWLLDEIDQRGRQNARAAAPGRSSSTAGIKHLGKTPQGWQVTETAHFRIYHKQGRDFAEKVAAVAEKTCTDMHRKWFETDRPRWSAPCDVYVYASAQEYLRATGVPQGTPGHSSFPMDAGRVVGRRMDLDGSNPNLLACVLPHETTHVVLAGQFGRRAVPRWADEGMAVLSEPPQTVAQHRRNLAQNQGRLFHVKDLMSLDNYPDPRQIQTFYAQSVVLVDYLTRQRGPRVFAQFLHDAMDQGYEQALQKHYGLHGFNDLQSRWNQQVVAEMSGHDPVVAGR